MGTNSVFGEEYPYNPAYLITDKAEYTYTENLDIVISGSSGDLALPITLEVQCDILPTPSVFIPITSVNETRNFDYRLATLGFGCYKQTSTATVKIQGTDISTSFKMNGEEPKSDPHTPLDLGFPITVFTDRTSYSSGDIITIYGQVRDLLSGTPVSLQVFASNGNLVTIEQVDVSYNKKFSTILDNTNDPLWSSSGTYTVKVLYGTQSRTAETTFEFNNDNFKNINEFPNPPPETNPDYGNDLFLGRPVESGSTRYEGFSIGYRSYGVEITNIDSDNQNPKLIFDVYTTASPAFLEITLQRNLLDAVSGGNDKDFVVMYQGSVADFEEIKTSSTHRTLHISGMHTRLPDYISENQVIEIIGTDLFGIDIEEPEPEQKITICHIPPGNPSNAHTISIPPSAWSAHQAHGDTRGGCQKDSFSKGFGDNQVIISIGSSVPGCEVIDECFQPFAMKINQGDTVSWYNSDSAGHTVTSGTPSDGPDGKFDSSLFMAGTTFSYTFDKEGIYPYFCMVHPWMVGEIVVGDMEIYYDSDIPVVDNTKQQEPKNIDRLTQSKTIDISSKQTTQSISIWSDKSSYVDGSLIHIDGKIKDTKPNSIVNIKVYSPSNFNIADERLFVSNDGKFEIDFDTSDKLWFENGEYVIKVYDQRNNDQSIIKVSVDEPQGEFLASAQEAPVIPPEKPSKDSDKLSDLIEENKKLREELERQGVEIDNLNKQVDYLGEILKSLQGLFSWAFP